MTKYIPLLNLLVLAVIPFLLRIEHRLTKLETRIEDKFCSRKDPQ